VQNITLSLERRDYQVPYAEDPGGEGRARLGGEKAGNVPSFGLIELHGKRFFARAGRRPDE